MNEIWKPIPGYEGHYEVSNLGRVKSLARTVYRCDGVTKAVRERILRPIPNRGNGGRLFVSLCLNGATTKLPLHRFVLAAFVGPKPPGYDGCHNDGDVTNNRLDNLRWDTRASNLRDKIRHGTSTRGERHNHAKLTEAQVLEIRELRKSGMLYREIAARYGVNRATVNVICLGQTWRHI